ncbi:MAG: DUF2147 domain-containing protein [Bacteroidetes bacterium]|nr:MAG: DUF2147 domain-containing protein [Bacteroidota bacterium]
MKKNLVFLFFFFAAAAVYSQQASDNFSGKWKTAEGKIIEISLAKGVHTGLALPEKKPILTDVKFRDGKWKGMAYNPQKGVTAACEVVFQDGNKLKITAFQGTFSKVIYWTRVQ